MSATTGSRLEGYRWRRERFIKSPFLRYGLLVFVLGYLLFAFGSLRINPQRMAEGIPRALRIFSSAWPPDFVSRHRVIVRGFVESLQITVLATTAGVLLSIPFAVMAARNVSVLPVYLFGRGVVMTARSLHPVVLGILFVKAVGLGAFAGILTLVFYTLGFVGKLLAEAIEEIKPGQIEAIRATGAGYLKMLVYAVFPQVLPRLIGLSFYQLDINLRASAIIGLVGAGGIGSTLNIAFARYDYATASAILIVLIAIILAAEWGSAKLRRFTR